MTSSASQPDLLGGWDSWAASTTAGMNSTTSKPSSTNTGGWWFVANRNLRNTVIDETVYDKLRLICCCVCSCWGVIFGKGEVSDL